MAALCLLAAQTAHAADFFWGRHSRRHWSLDVELGSRYLLHYNRETTRTTPPESLLGEFELTYFYKKAFGITAHYAYGFAVSKASTYGLGARIPFLTLPNPRSFLSGISFQLLFDLSHYQMVAPDSAHDYQASGFIFRYGVGIMWGLGKNGWELETSMTATRISGNFFVGPFFGIGYNF